MGKQVGQLLLIPLEDVFERDCFWMPDGRVKDYKYVLVDFDSDSTRSIVTLPKGNSVIGKGTSRLRKCGCGAIILHSGQDIQYSLTAL